MTPIVPRVGLFTINDCTEVLETSQPFKWMAKSFELHRFNSSVPKSFFIHNRFNLLVFVGPRLIWKEYQDLSIPKLYVDSVQDLHGDLIYNSYFKQSIEDHNPTISAFSPAHNSFEKIKRAYNSLVSQSFTDWEWIILDDSSGKKNYDYINEIVKSDHRVKLYKSNKKDSLVGSTKRQAASLCNGKYLVELDHDDELHHLAFDFIVSAFNKYPDAKFCYSNCSEVFETGGNVRYGDGFGVSYGKHYDLWYQGRQLVGVDVPVNQATIRHIVGVPNHFRCWERDFYFQLGRHNNKFAVVDDYELLVRTFLNTRIIHIQEMLYIQYMNAGGNNTQEPRRAEIQRLVDFTQKYYDKDIHNRVIELGANDFLWDELHQNAMTHRPKPKERFSLSYVYKI